MKYPLLTFAILLISIASFGQKERSYIREGNKEYKSKNYGNAIVSYNKALGADSSSFPAHYNLANAYYKTEKFDKATAEFSKLKGKQANKIDAAKMFHNMGNTYMKQQKYQESVDAYKSALKNNPNDDDTRYNLAYAMEKLKQQNKDKNKDKNKDNKDKKDNKNDKDKKDGKDNKDQNKNDDKDGKQDQKDGKQGDGKQPKYSKEEAQRYLDALKNDEKNVQDKVQKKKANQQKVSIEKDW